LNKSIIQKRHNKHAPYWAIALILFCSLGLATSWIDLGEFWKGYILDMVGPAWNYILFRGLFTAKINNNWTNFFTPNRTLFVFILACFGIEIAQYLDLYDSTYDPWDFLAYVSILIPLFLIDSNQNRK